MQQVRATYKVRDSWWTVLLVDPVAGRLARRAAGHRWLTPNRLTVTAFLLGLAAAAGFLTGAAGWLVAGVVLYHVSFVIDCVDGKLARLTGSGSVFGGWLDFFLDRLRVVICGVALFAGQFLATDRPVFLFAAIGFVFLALFGYVNGAETDKARAQLARAGQPPPDDTTLLRAAGAAGGLASRARAGLHRRRIRLNLVSGIEFEMAVLVLAPLLVAVTGPAALLWVTAVAAALLGLFELALIGRFWLATRAAVGDSPIVAAQPGPAGREATPEPSAPSAPAGSASPGSVRPGR
jgi:phosphatidylglycerophosphate synthase